MEICHIEVFYHNCLRVILDLRKILKVVTCHIEVLSGLFGYFGTGFLEVIFYLVFEQILQSRDISNLV